MAEKRGRTRRKPPSYLHHRPSGRAFCWVYDQEDRRRMVYLGAYGSAESHRRFAELRERHEQGRAAEAPGGTDHEVGEEGLILKELIERFLCWARGEYVREGEPTGEVRNIVDASRQLVRLFGDEQAAAFGPRKLKRVRDEMIHDGLARTNINQRVHRIRRVFRWAAEEELVPHGVWVSLRSVQALRYGRSMARETEPVQPCSPEAVTTVLAHVGRTVGTRPCGTCGKERDLVDAEPRGISRGIVRSRSFLEPTVVSTPRGR